MSFVKSSLKGKNIKMKNNEYLTKKREWSKYLFKIEGLKNEKGLLKPIPCTSNIIFVI
jgi:hypothetical protein